MDGYGSIHERSSAVYNFDIQLQEMPSYIIHYSVTVGEKLWTGDWFNLLWPSDVIWWQRSGWILVQDGYGLLPDITKWLLEPVLTYGHQDTIDIHLRTISQEIPQPLITWISLKLTYLKLHLNLPGPIELMQGSRWSVLANARPGEYCKISCGKITVQSTRWSHVLTHWPLENLNEILDM